MKDWIITGSITVLFLLSLISLRSIASFLFPVYFLYIFIGIISFFVFSKVDFDIWPYFYKIFYIVSIVFLLVTLLIGQVTRDSIWWLEIGPLSLQSGEFVRPFLLVFFARFLTQKQINLKRLGTFFLLVIFPVFLIVIQPSLGVSLMLTSGLFGVLLASGINKKVLFYFLITIFILMPLAWNILATYQKSRVISFLFPLSDPSGVGYQSIQSTIAVGSGKLTGRGLGEGVQTQLAFLPERHTDFIFASIAEELGLVGAMLVISIWFLILYRIVIFMENSKDTLTRAFLTGVFMMFLAQIFVHIGMNMGMLPITGIPLPLVSAGGSSLVATMITLGLVVAAKRQ